MSTNTLRFVPESNLYFIFHTVKGRVKKEKEKLYTSAIKFICIMYVCYSFVYIKIHFQWITDYIFQMINPYIYHTQKNKGIVIFFTIVKRLMTNIVN